MSSAPRTARGRRTREKILASALKEFGKVGYHDASIVRITEGAGVAMGTFYLYFDGKLAVFNELVEDLNRRLRHRMTQAIVGAPDRLAAERAGFRAFFEFTTEVPQLYRIIRQAEFVSPAAQRRHYENIVRSYVDRLAAAQQAAVAGEKIHEQERARALVAIRKRVVLDDEIQQVRGLGLHSRIGRFAKHGLLQIAQHGGKGVAALAAK